MEFKLFEQSALEPIDLRLPKEEQDLQTARNVLRLMMMGWQPNWYWLLTYENIKALIVKRNPQLVQATRIALQEGLLYLFEELVRHSPLCEADLFKANLYISNIISFLPKLDLYEMEAINLPQFVEGKWVWVTYLIEPIDISPSRGLKRWFIQEGDRVYAYGLRPMNHALAFSLLIFPSTTYPAGQGFLTQMLTNLQAYRTPGALLYAANREKIKTWLEVQNQRETLFRPVVVQGSSLGGAIALQVAIDLGQYLSVVIAHNPPGLYRGIGLGFKDKWDRLQEQGNAPEVIIQRQNQDAIPRLGIWKKQWRLLEVLPPASQCANPPFLDHILNYAGLEGTRFMPLANPLLDNEARTKVNFWWYGVWRTLAYYVVALPVFFFVKPAVRLFTTIVWPVFKMGFDLGWMIFKGVIAKLTHRDIVHHEIKPPQGIKPNASTGLPLASSKDTAQQNDAAPPDVDPKVPPSSKP